MLLRDRLRKHRFLSDVLLVAGGTAIGQGIVVLATPVLTRLYSPSDFGLLGIYTSILSILVVIASLRFELAIPLPEKDETAANLLLLAFLALLVVGFLAGVTVWQFGDVITGVINAPNLDKYLWLIPVGLVAAGAYQILNYWAVRKKAFSRIAQTKINQGMAMASAQIGLGVLKLGPLGLLTGHLFGQAGGTTTLALVAWREDAKIIKTATLQGICEAANRYRRFPLLSSGSGLFNSAGLHLPLLLIAGFYGPQVAGWFMLGQKVIGTPMSLIGRAVAQVYLGEGARLAREDPLAFRQLFLSVAGKLLAYGLVPIVLLAVGGPFFFGLVFGDSWLEAGRYVQLLALMFLVQFVVVPLSQTLNILEKQDWQLAWDAGRLILVSGGIGLVAGLGYSAWVAVLTYSLTMLVCYILLFFLGHLAIARHIRLKKLVF